MPGLLDNFASNPWLAIGSGLLSAAGPSTDPRQIGLGPGLMAGLGNMNAMQQAQQQQQLQALKVQQLKAQMAQAAQEQEQEKLDQERKARAIAALLENVPPEQRGLLGAVFNIDPGKAMGILEKMAIPEPPDLTTLQKEYQAEIKGGTFTGSLSEYIAHREKSKLAATMSMRERLAMLGRSSQTVNVGTDKKIGADVSKWVDQDGNPAPGAVAMMSVADAVTAGYTPATETQRVKATETAKAEVKAEEARKAFEPLAQEYQKAFREYHEQGDPGLISGERDRANRARNALVAWVAKNVLGTPGAEPSPRLYEDAEKLVPDFAGAIDSARFPAAMAQLRAIALSKLGKSVAQPRALMDAPTALVPPPPPPPGATLD